jgi:Rieske Fe-S protein
MTTPTPPVVEERRGFLFWLAGLLGAIATFLVAVPFVAYLVGPLRRKKPIRYRLGKVSDFPLGETRLVTFANPLSQPWDGMTGNTGVYVRYRGKDEAGKDDFLVLSMNCAHLGCPVSWFPQSGLFLCPCHGGVYYEDGERASGPPPRGMFPCDWEVENGELSIQAPHFPTLQDTLKHPE